MNPSQTLRDIASIAANPVVKERLELLASEFEIQHNQQNNNWAIALGQAQNTWEAALDNMKLDFLNKLELILIEMRKEFRMIAAQEREAIAAIEQLQSSLRGHDDT